MTEVTDFELPNVATGPNPFGLTDYAADPDRTAIVLLFLRDYHCRVCKKQVEAVAERYDEFEARDADVVAILPEPVDRTEEWVDHDIPYPLLADESKLAGDQYDQPMRFGALGGLHDVVGRMPKAVVVDTTGDQPTVAYTHRGTMPKDRPTIEEFLEEIDKFAPVPA